jgi:hypothetical protein
METFNPAPEKSGRLSYNEKIPWLVLLVLAALLRLGPIASNLPYIDYVDEGHILHPAIGLLKQKSFDSSVYTYPPLTSYLIVLAAKAYAPLYRLAHHHKLANDLPADQDFNTALGEQYDLITPPEIIWLGRLIVALLSVGTVVVAGALGRLLGGARTGLLAMLLVALCPALVSRASNLVIDTTTSFFAVLALYFCQRLRLAAASPPRRLWLFFSVLAGAASGLAFAGKYTAGAVFAAVLMTIFTIPVAWKSKVTLVLIAGAGLLAGIFCGVPGAILHPAKIVGELRGISRFYHAVQTDHGYWITALSGWEIGVPLMIAGLAGLVWMIRNAPTRLVVLSWIAFGLLLVSAVVWSSFQPFRNVLSLVPPLCLAAALFLVRAGQYLEQRFGLGALHGWLASGLIALVAGSLGWFSLLHLERRTTSIDTRIRAIDWLQQHSTKEQTVLGIRELAILPAEWKRIAANSVVVPWFEAADLLGQRHFDYIVTGEFDLRYAPNPTAWSAYLDRWKASIAALPVERNFGQVVTPVVPYLWRTNDERILILNGKAP